MNVTLSNKEMEEQVFVFADVANEPKAFVCVTTIDDYNENGDKNALTIDCTNYNNKSDFVIRIRDLLASKLGGEAGELKIISHKENFDDLGSFSDNDINEGYWDLINTNDLFTLQKVEMFAKIYGLSNNNIKDTIQDAIDRYQGFWMNDRVCVENYIAEFGSIKEADPIVSPYLTKEQYTAHFMKNISSHKHFYFNN